MRESKQRTSWLDSDPEYEARVLELAARGERARPARRRWSAPPSTTTRRRSGRWCSGRSCSSSPCPACPDTYQGCELVDLSLVDPDNRRPVDYDEPARAARARCATARPRDLDDEKLLVTHKALDAAPGAARRFGDRGDYQPLVGTSRHLVGFVRGGEVAVLVTRAAKRLEVVGGWERRDVRCSPRGCWRDELTGACTAAPTTSCADVLRATTRWRCCDGCTAHEHGTVWAPHAARRRPGHSTTGRHRDGRRRRTAGGAGGDARRRGRATPSPLDGGDPRPDPRGLPAAGRSARAGPRSFDPARYAWTDGDWRGVRAGGRR